MGEPRELRAAFRQNPTGHVNQVVVISESNLVYPAKLQESGDLGIIEGEIFVFSWTTNSVKKTEVPNAKGGYAILKEAFRKFEPIIQVRGMSTSSTAQDSVEAG